MKSSNQVEQIREHYQNFFGASIKEIFHTKGPAYKLPEGFRVLLFQKDSKTNVFTTCGMSFGNVDNPLELHLYCSTLFDQEARIAELLTIAAYFHITQETLGLNHTFNWGEPMIENSSCDHGYISLPYIEGPKLENMPPLKTKFLWLIPVTATEVMYKKKNGINALEDLFEQEKINYPFLLRKSLI